MKYLLYAMDIVFVPRITDREQNRHAKEPALSSKALEGEVDGARQAASNFKRTVSSNVTEEGNIEADSEKKEGVHGIVSGISVEGGAAEA